MRVIPAVMTVAEYVQQLLSGSIVINRDYQRSSKVWPASARSYLIDTILKGFPLAKLYLYQRTDVKSRQVIKEVVDGQQRSEAIRLFYLDKLRLTAESDHRGKVFSKLSEEDQRAFLEYGLGCDIFVEATEKDVREVFRRMNSYMVPLNRQEKRHSTYQGAFKWFMVDISRQYAQAIKDMGILTEGQLTRMQDTELLAELSMAMEDGITTSSPKKIDDFYDHHNDEFDEAETRSRLVAMFNQLFVWREIHNTLLLKPYSFYSLALAVMHRHRPIPALQLQYQVTYQTQIDDQAALANLTVLLDALESPDPEERYADFVRACSAATNTVANRATRFRFFSRAIDPDLVP